MDHNGVQCAEIKKVVTDLAKVLAEFPLLEKRVEKLENKTDEHAGQLSTLFKAQAETKVYVKQILSNIDNLNNKFDSLDNNFLNFLQQITNNATQERIEDRKVDAEERKDFNKERGSTTKEFLGFAKYVVGATIGALITGAITYIKLKG